MLDPRTVVDGENGVSGSLTPPSWEVAAICAFTALNWANTLELNVRIWAFFKVYRGLYFFSILLTSWACVIYGFFFLSKFFAIVPVTFVNIGFIWVAWMFMVTGQSLVLYSRLHLVMQNRRKIRWILYMIVFDAIIFGIPIGVFVFGSNSADASTFAPLYVIYEKVQVTGFSIQEIIISVGYIYETWQMLKPSAPFRKDKVRRVLFTLIYINIGIILMDWTILGTEYAGWYDVQVSMKGAIYSFKLRLEFDILNQLMKALGTTPTDADPAEAAIAAAGKAKNFSNASDSSHSHNYSKTDTNCWSANTTLPVESSNNGPPIPRKAAATLMGKLKHGDADKPSVDPEEKDIGRIEMTTESIVESRDKPMPPLPAPHQGQPQGAPVSPFEGEREEENDRDRDSFSQV